MIKYSQVSEEDNSWKKIDAKNYIAELNERDRSILREFRRLYADITTDDLIRITYLRYPYYVLNSEIAEDVLSIEELNSTLTH